MKEIYRCAGALLCFVSAIASADADWVLRGGKVYSMDATAGHYSALAIEGNRLVWMGDSDAAAIYIGPLGTVFTVGAVNVEGAGFLSEDQQTVEAVTVNSSGYFNNLTLIRVGGARAKGAENASAINEQTLLFPSQYGD